MKPLTLGIDPGLSGAVAVLRGDSVELLEDLPTVQFSTARIKNRIDGAMLASMLEPYASDIRLAVVEHVGARPGEAASGAFCFGFTSGCILGVLGALQIPYVTPTPIKWKNVMGLSKDKALSRSKAVSMFPGIANKLTRVRDHDRAEAVLLAAYGEKL
jgi:crossover junction endodeoxyribonuclease RuvC